MNEKNKQFIELVGVLAVVASLVFVGMQLQLDRRLAAAEQYSTRAESRMENLRTNLESEGYLAFIEGRWNYTRPIWWDSDLDEILKEYEFTTRDLAVAWITNEIDLLTYDNLYHQYQEGLLEEEFWLGAEESLKGVLQNPIRRVLLQEAYFPRPINSQITDWINQGQIDLL